MVSQRAIVGVCVALMLVGLLLICFAPGGFLNTEGGRGTIDVPGVQITLDADRGPELSRPGPVAGFVLLGVGVAGLLAGLMLKRPRA
jgi:hypothetical protein